MAAMTKSGFLVPGDQLLAVFAKDIVQHYPGTPVVFDIKASLGLIELLEKWGAKPIICPCGHAIIKEQMEKTKARIGGELSCHFFFKDRHFGYDDGIYAMMRLFEIIHLSGKSLDELIKIFPKKYSSPEIRLECPEDNKQIIIDYLNNAFQKRTNAQIITIDGIRVTLPYGWINVRASNTQPVLSMRLEADTAENLVRIKNELILLLGAYYDKTILEKAIQ
jgi:phosphomannomutase/phosphoglucomutase